jgi:hypothetical protein
MLVLPYVRPALTGRHGQMRPVARELAHVDWQLLLDWRVHNRHHFAA